MSKKTCLNAPHCTECHAGGGLSRRDFVGFSTAALGSTFLSGTAGHTMAAMAEGDEIAPFEACGPGAAYVPSWSSGNPTEISTP
jgi:hypothetical protein